MMFKGSRMDFVIKLKGECHVLICKSCFSRNNNELMMRAIWKGHERSKRIRKQRDEEC